MTNAWQRVPLGTAITLRKRFFTIDDTQTYRRCRVQSYGQGVVLRDIVFGAEVKTKQQQLCFAGEFLVAEIDAKVGGFGIVPPELDGAIVSSHYFLFVINETQLDRRYLSYYICTPDFQDQVTAKGTTNYAAIRPQHVLEYEIPLPPLDEQQRIVARIDALASRIAEARGLRQGAVEEGEALVNSEARRIFKELDIAPTFLNDWVNQDREGIQTGPFGAQLGSADFREVGHPVLTIGNIQFGGLRLEGLRYVSEEKAEQLRRYTVQEGDIVFARMGTVGRCCVVPQDSEGWIFNYHIIRVAVDHNRAKSRYLHWIIKASPDVEEYLADTVRGGTRDGVNTSIVSRLPCRVPPLDEQRRIVTYLDSLQAQVDQLKQLQAESAAELDALLPSILDQAFKGEL